MVRGGRAALGLMLMLSAACGDGDPSVSGSSSPTTGAPAATAPTAPAAPAGDIPDAVVRDVATGADVNVRALAVSDRPTLYWFWAPH
jgi:hypothetical protein